MSARVRFAFGIVAITLLLGDRYCVAADLILAADGRSDYQIVLPNSSPSPSIEECLRQTGRLIQTAFRANGCDVAIVTEEKHELTRPAIFLGDTAFARTQGIPLSSLKGWSYVQKVVGRDVIIAGRDQPSPAKSLQERRPAWDRLGTAKGVVDFLRQYAGTRFLYPDLAPYQPISSAAKIDLLSTPSIEFLKVPKISVPADLNVTVSPRLEFNTSHPARGSFYDIANNRFPLVDSVFGGHTYERAIPRDKYADAHPEYFALINGERTAKGTGNAQYCISNPEVQELFYQDLITLIDRGFEGVDLGQPDGFRACQCENCTKLFDTGSDWGEKLWILHRMLAERVEKARPGKQVTMMSYIQTENPPKSFQKFPPNTRILLTGTNEEDIVPWRGHDVPMGFSSYIYNWCPNLGTRYTPMRTPRFVESQAKRLTRNKFQSVYRDGPGELYGLEGPVYYTMGRMFDDPEHLQAKQLVHEFCAAAFDKSAPSMIAFYDQLYHGIELYSEFLGTRSPAWVYHNIYGQRRKFLTDPFQFLGFLYTPNLLGSLEAQLVQAEKIAAEHQGNEKVQARLLQVRREFDYLKGLAKVVHLYHAYQIQPDLVTRDRLLEAIDSRNTFINSMFDAKGANPKPVPEWGFVMFPPLGHDARHLRLAYDGYQEPFANSPMNWDTKSIRLSPLPGARRLTVRITDAPVTIDSPLWTSIAEEKVSNVLADQRKGEQGVVPFGPVAARAMADPSHLYIRIEAPAPKAGHRPDTIDLYLAPLRGSSRNVPPTGPAGQPAPSETSANSNTNAKLPHDIIYRFTVSPGMDSRSDAANGFNSDPLDPRYGQFDPDWNGNWSYQSRVDIERQTWTALIVIPFATLNVQAPTAGLFWRGNIGHTHRVAEDQVRRSLWSATNSTRVMDDRNEFGEFVFESLKK